MRRRDSLSIPRSMALAAVLGLVVGYVALTGIDHLHLHIEHEHAYAHDHLNIGHHGHSHNDHHDEGPEDREGQTKHCDSVVVSFAQATQERPVSIAVHVVDEPTTERPWTFRRSDLRAFDCHPSWSSRAPPA